MKKFLFFFLATLALPSQAALSDFMGSWVSEGSAGLTQLKIGTANGGFKLAAKAKCGAGECDWGTVDADAYASSVGDNLAQKARAMTAIFERGFKESILTLQPAGTNRLSVTVYTRFLDGSNRTDYVSSYKFRRRPGLPPKQLPDLIVVKVSDPVLSQGRSVMKAVVKNIGSAAASASILRLIDHSTLQSTGAPENSIAHVGGLSPGQSQTVKLILGYDVFNPRAELEYTADYKGMVSESNESNNVLLYNQ